MTKNIEFHLHVNHFGKTLPKALLTLQEKEDFTPANDQIKEDDGTYNSLWIVTKKIDTEQEARQMFDAVLTLMRSDADMNGYMECEMVGEQSIEKYTEVAYDSSVPFPYERPIFIHAERGADIHIFRSKDTPYDELDRRLEDVGFYEVITQEERIWTFLMEDAEDAELLFQDLKMYLQRAGGASKIEKEVVMYLSAAPENFALREVAKAGFYKRS